MAQARSHGADTGRKRAVIFDFDGTIADSLRAVVEVLEGLPGVEHDHKKLQRLRGLSVPELMRALDVPPWRALMFMMRARQMLKHHMHGIAVHVGMADAIATLHQHGVPLYVLSTNSTENVQKYLQWHRLSQYFTTVSGGASMWGKAPRLLKLIEQGNVDVANSWYVGDETRDVSAARAVGLKSVSVTWGYNTRPALERKAPDALADTAEQLLEALKDVWKK